MSERYEGTPSGFLARLRRAYQHGGLVYFLFYPPLWYHLYRALPPQTFRFLGKTYHNFLHRYNRTWRNERAIEVPIITDLVDQFQGRRILEVGNVLSHYLPITHTVLDKYESGAGLINADVVDYVPESPFDLIVSISTLEHVGFDEQPQNPDKIGRALQHLTSLLVPGGRLVVTLPIGYNPHLDALLERGAGFNSLHCLVRSSWWNHWKQVDWEVARRARFNHYYPGTNGIVVGIIDKPA